MKTNISLASQYRVEVAATMLEVAVSVALFGFAFISLFTGMSMTSGVTRMAREDQRATQILLERLEGIRLFDWGELVYSNSLRPATFTASYYPFPNSSGSTGITYYGTMTVTNASMSPSATYTNQLRAIIVSVYWTNSGVRHQRTMSTYQAQYGMQNYLFNN